MDILILLLSAYYIHRINIWAIAKWEKEEEGWLSKRIGKEAKMSMYEQWRKPGQMPPTFPDDL